MHKNFIITGIERIIFIGSQEFTSKESVFESYLPTNELVYSFDAKSTLLFNGKIFSIEPNQIRYMPKGENNVYKIIERKQQGSCIDIYFHTDIPVSTECFVQNLQQNKLIGKLFEKAFSIWVAKNEGYYFECISLLYKIFAELQKSSYLPNNKYHMIKPAVDYIEDHFYEPNLSCQMLANMCGISYSYMNQLFLNKFSVPPKKYIIQMKLNYASDLLLAKKYSISQIAEMSGFSDSLFFSRQFKEYMGISPTEYRNKYISSKK